MTTNNSFSYDIFYSFAWLVEISFTIKRLTSWMDWRYWKNRNSQWSCGDNCPTPNAVVNVLDIVH